MDRDAVSFGPKVEALVQQAAERLWETDSGG